MSEHVLPILRSPSAEISEDGRGESAAGRRMGARAVGALFRSAREDQRLSQGRVSELTEEQPWTVPRATVSDIERGRTLPSLEALVSLSRVLHVDPLEVLERLDGVAAAPGTLLALDIDELGRRAAETFRAGRYREALALYDAVRCRIERAPPDGRERQRRLARNEIDRAVALRRSNALRAAQTAVERGVELTAELPDLRAEAYIVLAGVLSWQGLTTLALDAAERGILLARSIGEARLLGQALDQRGNVLFRAGRIVEARDAFFEALALATEFNDHASRVRLEGNLGSCLARGGQPGAARTRFLRAVDLARRHGEPALEASWLVELGRIELQRGNLDAAARHGHQALHIARPRQISLTVFRAHWLLHQTARALTNDPDVARLRRLRRLHARLKDHRFVDAIREYEAQTVDS